MIGLNLASSSPKQAGNIHFNQSAQFVLSCNHYKDNLTYSYPVIRAFFPTQLLAITKSFAWLVSHIVSLFTLGGLIMSFSLGINKPNMRLTSHSNKAMPEKKPPLLIV